MVLAIGCAVLTGLKQWQEGPDQAISSRYLVWSTMFWIGLLILSVNTRVSKRARQLLVTQVAVLGILASAYGAYRADERHNAFELGKAALLTNTTELHLLYMYPTLDVPKQMRNDLVHYKLSLFQGTGEATEVDE